jgi:hypothetical protein
MEEVEIYIKHLYCQPILLTPNNLCRYWSIAIEFQDDTLLRDCQNELASYDLFMMSLIRFSDVDPTISSYFNETKDKIRKNINSILHSQFYHRWDSLQWNYMLTEMMEYVQDETKLVLHLWCWCCTSQKCNQNEFLELLSRIDWRRIMDLKILQLDQREHDSWRSRDQTRMFLGRVINTSEVWNLIMFPNRSKFKRGRAVVLIHNN